MRKWTIGPSTGFLVLETAGCVGLIMALVAMLGERRTVMDVLHFVVPITAAVTVLLWCEWREGRGGLQTRIRRAWALLGPFAAGAIVPVAIFLVPFIATGSLNAFADGVFGALERRFGQAERPLPGIEDMVWALPYGVALVAVALGRHARWSLVAASAAALALLAGLATIDEPSSYLALWNSVRFLPLFVMLAGCVLLLARPLAVSSPKREQAFLLLLVLAAIGMVQFPFSAPIYFSYTHRCWPLLRRTGGQPGSASAPSHNTAGIPRLCGHVSECRLCLEHRRRPSSRIRGHRYQTADPVTTAHPSR